MANTRERMHTLLTDTPLKRRVVRAISWSVLGTGAAQGLFLIASILTARWLGAEDFGRLGLIQFTLNTLVTFIAPSFGWSLMRLAATLRDHDLERLIAFSSAVMQVGAAVSLILSVGLAVCAPWVCSYWFNDPATEIPLRIAALSVFANGVFTLQVSVLAGFEAFRESAMLNTLRGVLLATLMAGGAYWSGLDGAAWGFTVSSYLSVLAGVAVLGALLRERKATIRWTSWRHGSEVLRDVSLPSFLSTVLSSLTMWAGSVLLARAPNGLAQVA
ncbi:MAG: oligosaccharide flippase family protein, partial [Fimbriimonadales bacterium]